MPRNDKIGDLDGFRYPNRRPWLLLILVVVITIVVIQRTRKPDRPEKRSETVSEAVEEQRVDEGAGEEAASAPAEPLPDVADALSRARRLENAGEWLEARNAYRDLLDRPLDARTRDSLRDRLGSLNIKLLLEPYPMPEKEDYVVQRGDSVDRIARRFGTTVELIQVSNRLANPNLIKAGDLLRVLDGDFTIEISKSKKEMVVLLNGEFFKRYAIGTGKYDKTPVGTFVVTEKEKEPVWWPKGREVPFGHPDNILGTRWLGIRATGDTPPVSGYGIHGTWDDASIGKAESAGCVRMHNPDVEELFVLIPSGTPVTITQ